MEWADYGDWTSADTLALNNYIHTDGYANGCVEALFIALSEKYRAINLWWTFNLRYTILANPPTWQFDAALNLYYFRPTINGNIEKKKTRMLVGKNTWYTYVAYDPLSLPAAGEYTVRNEGSGIQKIYVNPVDIVDIDPLNIFIFMWELNHGLGDGIIAIALWVELSIEALIPYFANHTVNGGDFDGQTSIPMWQNKQEMLDYLGEEEVLRPFAYISKEWVFQQYKLINLLRWTLDSITSTESPSHVTDIELYIKDFTDADWDICVAGFNNEGYTMAAIANVFPAHEADKNFPSEDYTITRNYNSFNYENITRFDKTASFHVKMTSQLASDYENNDYPVDSNEIYNFQDVALGFGDIENVSIGDLENNTMTEPTEVDRINRWSSLQLYVLNKYNVTGGFEFQDNTI